MEKAKGTSQQGTGRPQNEGTTQLKVTVFLGRDKMTKESKRKQESLTTCTMHELDQSGQLRDTVKLILEHFK